MKQNRNLSFSDTAIALACFLIGGILIAGGLLHNTNSQQLSIKVTAMLVGFSGGFFLAKMTVGKSIQLFKEAVAKREQEIGRPLTSNERSQVNQALRTMASTKTPGFRAYLMRLVSRILLIAVSVTFLLTLLVTIGALFVGFGAGLLLNASRLNFD